MRYIGSKANLLLNIENCILSNIRTKQKSFCDIFSGTGVVARYFKPRYEIISNDALFFSYIIQKSIVENNSVPTFDKLKFSVKNPFDYLENTSLPDVNKFVEENYSPSGKAGRMYFTSENARRIDFIRTTIEQWKNEKKLTEAEYYYLLASLIEAVPSVSNITGTYGAYLKNWDKRAYKKLSSSNLMYKITIEITRLTTKMFLIWRDMYQETFCISTHHIIQDSMPQIIMY